MKKKILIALFGILFVGAALAWTLDFANIASGARSNRNSDAIVHLTDEEIYRELKKFALIFQQAREFYVEPVDERKMLEAAMNGMLNSLDPHSAFLSKDDLREFTEGAHGRFGGLGIQITADRGAIRVIAPIDDTPAARAGIQAGDLITHIDGDRVGTMTLNQAVNKMKGRPGTRVRLSLITAAGDRRDITLTRAMINVKSVRFRAIGPNNNIGYIRIANFGRETTRELRDAITRLERQNVVGYVLDMRNNPGGYLAASINVADAFLDGENLEIVSTRGRNPEDIDRSMATSGDLIKGKPLVVLINQGSASASEIVAGAIQDNKRGIIMGAKSFGKGSVQQQRPLGDGTAMHLTVARYFTPSGRAIDGKGVEPDIEVLQSEVTVTEVRDRFDGTVGSTERAAERREPTPENPLTDEERDERDYQLQRAMAMVLALNRLPRITCPVVEE